MTQALELAKQGDAQAINALVNRSLNPQGITAKVLCQGDQMKIRLESLDIPDKENLTKYLIQGLGKIGVTISYLEVYGKRTGQEGYAWTRAFRVEGGQFTPVAAGNSAAPAPVADAPIAEAGDNPFLATAPAATTGKPKSSMQGMRQDDILAQAQDGNLDAIEVIVRAALADKEDLVPLIELNGDVLKVTIETKQFLDGQSFCGEFGTKMNVLAGGVIKELEIYKRKSEKNAPFLMKKTGLFTQAEAAVASAPPEAQSYEALKGRQNGQSSAMRSTAPASNYQSNGSQGRPAGALVVAILYFILGGMGIFGGIGTLMGAMLVGAAMNSAASQAGTTVAPSGMAAIGGIIFLLSLLLFAIGIARIAIGVGILKMKEWARAAAIFVEGLSSLRNMLAIFSGEWLFSFIGIGISVAISIYLLRDDVRRGFS
jgi:hypothetical protein